MTIQDLGSLGELIGSVAVLATLAYLTVQTRQNTAAIGAQLDSTRIMSILSLNTAALTSNEVQEALAQDRAQPADINDIRRTAYWRSLFLVLEWQFTQGRRGSFPSYDAERAVSIFRTFSETYASFEQWWDSSKSIFFPEFVEFVEEQREKAA